MKNKVADAIEKYKEIQDALRDKHEENKTEEAPLKFKENKKKKFRKVFSDERK